MRLAKPLRLFLAAGLAFATLAVSSGAAAAYGSADHPLAQIEVSANCNNPSFALCAPPPAGVGLGGIWLWIEIDQGGIADVAGAACERLKGVGGGANSIRGEAPWWPFNGSVAALQTAFPGTFVVGTDPGNNYYVVPFGLAFPVTTGHYSFRPVAGVTVQAQVAP